MLCILHTFVNCSCVCQLEIKAANFSSPIVFFFLDARPQLALFYPKPTSAGFPDPVRSLFHIIARIGPSPVGLFCLWPNGGFQERSTAKKSIVMSEPENLDRVPVQEGPLKSSNGWVKLPPDRINMPKSPITDARVIDPDKEPAK